MMNLNFNQVQSPAIIPKHEKGSLAHSLFSSLWHYLHPGPYIGDIRMEFRAPKNPMVGDNDDFVRGNFWEVGPNLLLYIWLFSFLIVS